MRLLELLKEPDVVGDPEYFMDILLRLISTASASTTTSASA